MGQLEQMAIFVRIVEAGGIGKAAEQLDLAKSAVSRRLVELETRLDTRLLIRTTRKSKLTDAGQVFYQRAVKILDDVAQMNNETSCVDATLNGTLRMAVPLSFGLMHLTSAIDEFCERHPDLTIEIDFADRQIDLVEEGYELAIRIADLKDSSLQAKRITPVRHVLCASPDYLDARGTPETITDLKQHQFLQYGKASHAKLHITDPKGKTVHFPLTAKMKANNGDFLRDMAIAGHGITYLPTFIAWQAVLTGELVPLLCDHKLPVANVYAVYPQTRFLSQRARVLIDFMAERFGDNPYWDQK
ncbi:LysR family transcriptional regulator [Thalassomonas actiniarum]|uniref:LysR family transcriptional regulator n=1 Tax=Thalassomonas actiniarum TaxID=485447 RepID=A0AAE9YK18_9GAMM|nr:LysR family transcriptional regulator [Thalassomonas actiniarum]WDD97234.1 LysR family transcriptional regulator [Thalassomonas actiniarum]